jgi:hypothetical protein
MERLYYNIDEPSGFASKAALLKAYKKVNENASRKDVDEFLKGSDTYTRHVVQPSKFPRRPYMVIGPGHTLGLDSAHMVNICDENDGIRYILFAMDMFSRFLFVEGLKSLRGVECVRAMKRILDRSIYTYKKVMADNGTEFLNAPMRALYDKHGLILYHSHNRAIKNGMVERVIRTIKAKLFKYLTHAKTLRYIDILQKIVDTYNVTPHRGLVGATPFDVHSMTNPEALFRLKVQMYKKRCPAKKTLSRHLPVDTYTRISSIGVKRFRKGYEPRQTREVFRIKTVNTEHCPITYSLVDLDGNPIEGSFYREELVPTVKPETYDIEVLDTRKRRGVKQHLVKYLDYPASVHTWINAEQLAV